MGADYKEIKDIGQGAFGKLKLVEKDNQFYALKKIPIKELTQEEIEDVMKKT